MEDTSYSGIKKNSRQLKFYHDKSNELSSEGLHFAESLELSNSLKKSSSQSSSHFKFHTDSKNINIEDQVSQQFSVKIPNTKTNASSLVKLYEKLTTQEYDVKKAKKDLTKELKSRVSLLKNINKLYPHKNDNLLNELLLLKEELSKLKNRCSTISNLPKSLLSLNFISGYESCQILIHEKGNLEIQNYYSGPTKEIKSGTIKVQSFNSIFNLIKKSKNKQFNQSQILKEDLGVVGTFLAKDLELKDHSIILIISRNAFLPPSQSEIDSFESLSELLIPLFAELLLSEKQSRKLKLTRLALDNFPMPIAIKSSLNGSVLFCNRSYGHDLETKKDIFNLNNELELHIYEDSNSSTSSDIYHQQRVQLLGELLNTLQHELSNPLFGLKLSSDLLLMDSEDEEVLETLKEISDNSLRCQTIIENFSHLYSDKNNYINLDIVKLLKETITLTKSASKEIPKEVVYEGLSDDQLNISTNPTWISQIIFNLIINSSQAIKSITNDFRDHKIIIKLVNENEKILIKITDSGPGISVDNFDSVMKPFFTTKSEGTGLGLSICKNLATKLGGNLSYINNKDKGVTFTLKLPKTNESIIN